MEKFNINDVEHPKNLVEIAKFLTGHENIASKNGFTSNMILWLVQ